MAAIQIGAMPMPATFKYRDVFLKGFPKHDGWDWFKRKHPPMPASKWAKIYAPFDALKGFDEAISSKEVRYVDRIQLDDGQQKELSHKLSVLHNYTYNGRMARENQITVTVEYFVPCSDPDHYAYVLHRGSYVRCTGMVLNVDDIHQTITLQSSGLKTVICFDDILSIETKKAGLFDIEF